jgi:quercetin dioxygenase-like cupin family protein
MTMPTFEAFRAAALEEGFDEVLEREWAPDTLLETHSHPFAVKALVVKGDFGLTINGQTRQLQAGDRFALDRDVPHSERYGAEGAVYWVARKNA